MQPVVPVSWWVPWWGGRLSGIIGRKAILIASISAFGCFSLATSVMPGMTLRNGARFLTGPGLGGAMPKLFALPLEAWLAGKGLQKGQATLARPHSTSAGDHCGLFRELPPA